MPAKNMGKPVNTKDHDATVGLSNSGNNLFIYQNGDLFESALIGNVWSDPAPFPKVINSSYMESSASPSYNFREIYFVSSRTDNSYGGKDIFKTTRSSAESNRWSDAINLGNTINTNYDEEGAFIHPDGKTLYFSSKGHNSMGGYDIFTTTLQQNGTWSTPENLGYPVNTPDDDVFFVVEASGKYGFYSSVRSDGYGETDIYRITFLGEEKPVVLSTEDNLIASIAQPVKEIVLEEQIGIKTIRLTIVKGKISVGLPDTSYQPGIVTSPLHFWLPELISKKLQDGFKQFGKRMYGYLTNEAAVIGVESRTSSPVRIPRNHETLCHVQIAGLYPAGEGAGYAGGIVSAAVDGERCAEKVAEYKK